MRVHCETQETDSGHHQDSDPLKLKSKKFFLDSQDLRNVSDHPRLDFCDSSHCHLANLTLFFNFDPQVFSLYGAIECIKISKDKCSALVTFENAINASLACLSLNKRWLAVNQAYLYVNIVNPIKEQAKMRTQKSVF